MNRTTRHLAVLAVGVSRCRRLRRRRRRPRVGRLSRDVETGSGDLEACPDPIVIQTDWFPEAEHGAVYELVGEGYTVDTGAKIVSGPLVAGGQDAGHSIEIRTGGPAIGFQPVSVQQYADDSITLGYANTEGQIQRWDETPVISVVAPLEINPQIIYWDPETYPDVETLADLGEEGVTINVFEAGTFADVFVAEGVWQEAQVDARRCGSTGPVHRRGRR